MGSFSREKNLVIWNTNIVSRIFSWLFSAMKNSVNMQKRTLVYETVIKWNTKITYRQVFIRSSRRSVDQQIIQMIPIHIAKKLLNESILFWTSPNQGRVFRRKKESGGHDRQIVFDVDRTPTGSWLVYLFIEDAKNPWSRRAAQIDV